MTTIVLNDALKETPISKYRAYDVEGNVARKLEPKWDVKPPPRISMFVEHASGEGTTQVNGLLGMVSQCYSNHIPLAIAPHDLWFMLMTQISAEINKSPENYRSVFTTSAEKQDIVVVTGDPTYLPLDAITNKLNELIPNGNAKLFDPELSTHRPMTRRAVQGAFADAVQHFFNYSTMMCGIPSVKILGIPLDWATIHDSMEKISSLLGGPIQQWYLKKLYPILDQFHEASCGRVDIKFWTDIYTHKNVGSGGELAISGWIRNLFLEQPEHGSKLQNFRSTIAVVPYKNLKTKRNFKTTFTPGYMFRDSDIFAQLGYVEQVFEILNQPVDK